MNKYLLFLLIFLTKIALAQLNDTFEDGDFMHNPVWTGSNSGNDFTVVVNQLRSNSVTASSNFYLATTNQSANNCIWEFWCNLKFATSGTNYVDVYLVSDQENLQSATINGYFIRIGNTNDEICLYKRSGAVTTNVKLIDGADAVVNSTTDNKIKIKVTRTADNQFTLQRDMSGTGTNYVTEGIITDATFTTSAFFGIFIQQSTSSFFQKHFFDDITISTIPPPDITPPQLTAVKVLDGFTLEATFNEPIDNTSATTLTNYSLNNGYGNPSQVTTTTDPAKYRLRYSSELITADYTLTVTNVKDVNNNMITTNNTVSFRYKKPYIPQKGDVVFNELFPDPSPQVDLPGVEFVELQNISSETIYLQNWRLKDPGTTAIFPADSIRRGEFVILCAKADTNEYKRFGKTIGISPWPSLNNAGDKLELISAQNLSIDSVQYADTWYKDAVKKAGGWTLEKINHQAVCKGIQNWEAGKDPSGGTPGRRNSLSTDEPPAPLTLLKAALTNDKIITLTFNQPVDSLSASVIEHFTINNGLGKPQSVLPLSPYFREVNLFYPNSVIRGKTYTATVSQVTNCVGSIIASDNNSATFFYPSQMLQGNILISEILFNPKPNGVDFLEIYNASGQVLDLQELSVANTDAEGNPANIRKVSTTPYLFQPNNYLVLSVNPDNIRKEYSTPSPDAFLSMATLPSFNDDAGTVLLLSGNIQIDRLDYTDKMHFPLIKDPEGVSLERSSFNRSADDSGNFRSAASTVGYATPGYQNSQQINDDIQNDGVTLLSKTFSPDNDGFEDVLTIVYHLDDTEWLANVSVFDSQGHPIRKLAQNSRIPAQGAWVWDGLNEQNEKAPLGVYLLYAELYNMKGEVRKYRKNFVLATKLN